MAATQAVRQLDQRDAAALTSKMTVLDDVDRARNAPGLYLVVSESGRSYLVDGENEACECDDSFYRDPAGGCKHVRRVAFAIGERDIPDWANESQVDPQLGSAVEAEGSA